MGWYLTVKSNLAALTLDFRQKWLFQVFVEATADTAQIFWHHWGIMELGEGVLICETALKPMRSIVIKVPFGLRFVEGIGLPRTL